MKKKATIMTSGRALIILLLVFGLLSLVASQDYKPPKPNPSLSLDQLPDARPPKAKRKFVSALVDEEVESVASKIRDKALKRIWMNAYPNTLDTTVAWHNADEKTPLEEAQPLSVLITGDITASWLRDSASQINPYLHLLQDKSADRKEWEKLYRLALGLVYMQSKYIIQYPYANSFGPPSIAKIQHPKNGVMNGDSAYGDWIYPPPDNQTGHWAPGPSDRSAYMPKLNTDGVYVYEAKYEIDSLANFIRLAVQLARYSGRKDFVHSKYWREALGMALSLAEAQQRSTEEERDAQNKALEASQKKLVRSKREALGHQSLPHSTLLKVRSEIQALFESEKEEMEEYGENWKEPDDQLSDMQHMPDLMPMMAPSEFDPTPGLQRQRVEPSPRSAKGKRASQESTGSSSGTKNGKSVTLSEEWERRFAPLGGYYRYQRLGRSSSETRTEDGFGQPAARSGMVKSAFRPSDDAQVLPFFVPGNAMLVTALTGMADLLKDINTPDEQITLLRDTCTRLAAEVKEGITKHAIVSRADLKGDVFAYETDGYGSHYFMDDANVPSLLSLPYLGYIDAADPIYQRTRELVLSNKTNQYYFSGPMGEGVGGPHCGYGKAWPMSRSMQILTTKSPKEQLSALQYLRKSTTGTGLIHESVDVYNSSDFTREWFAWTNGLFGEAILHVLDTNPDLLTEHVY